MAVLCVLGLARIMPHNAKLYSVDPDKRESMPYEVLREQMRGYHASISFLDHQLGRLLDAFDRVRAGPSHLILLRTPSIQRPGRNLTFDNSTPAAAVPACAAGPCQRHGGGVLRGPRAERRGPRALG